VDGVQNPRHQARPLRRSQIPSTTSCLARAGALAIPPGGKSGVRAQPIDNNMIGAGIKMYPDGTEIVCDVNETQSDAWLMENFDPEVK